MKSDKPYYRLGKREVYKGQYQLPLLQLQESAEANARCEWRISVLYIHTASIDSMEACKKKNERREKSWGKEQEREKQKKYPN